MALRIADIAVTAIALCAAVASAPAAAAKINAPARAKVVKPLALRSVQDFDLGTIVLSAGSWSGAVVGLSRSGALTCSALVTCSGITQVAVYRASGSNGETASISAPDVTLANQSDPSKILLLTVDSPASVTFTNSGAKGVDFPLGGSVTLDSTTAAGVYTGTFEVSVEYQ